MGYIAKLETKKGRIIPFSCTANNRAEARQLIEQTFPGFDIISLEPGRHHKRLDYVR